MERCRAILERVNLQVKFFIFNNLVIYFIWEHLKCLSSGQLPAVGRVFLKCTVISVKNFGVFITLGDEFPGVEGLIHISELHTDRIRNIEGFVKPGSVVDAKVIGLSDDGTGRVRMSRKAYLIDKAEKAKEEKAGIEIKSESVRNESNPVAESVAPSAEATSPPADSAEGVAAFSTATSLALADVKEEER